MDAPFAPFELRWDRPQLGETELRETRSAFEWWYFDLATEDDVSLVAVFGRKNPVLSAQKPSLYLEYSDRNTSFRRVRTYPLEAFSWQEGESERGIRLDKHSVMLRGDRPEKLVYEVEIELPELSASLRMEPSHLGFLPSADGRYFHRRDDPAQRTCVSFSAPIMRVQGSLVVKGRKLAIEGRGYHDHPWGTRQLFWTHRQWNWARVSDPAGDVMFAKVEPAKAFEGGLHFVYLAERDKFEPQVGDALAIQESDWKRGSWYGVRCPHTLGVEGLDHAWQADTQRSLLDAPVYNRSQIRWQPEPRGPQGTGWLEYYTLAPLLRWPAFWMARLVTFFWRPFPFFGR